MRTLWHDLRYGARMLLKSPGVTAVAVLSLALGIGANTTIFSVLNTLLLRPLPVSEPERLAKVYTRFENDSRYMSNSYPDYRDLRERNQVFTDLASSRYLTLAIRGVDKPEVVLGEVVSANYFDVLGVRPSLGRAFLPDEGRTEGTHPVTVLSYEIWRRSFGEDPNIVGKEVLINTLPFTVVGVAPQGFQSLHIGVRPDIWIPIMMQSATSAMPLPLENRSLRYLRIVGRLAPGVTVEQADSHIATLAEQLAKEYPDSNSGNSAVVLSCKDDRLMAGVVEPGVVRGFLTILMVLVGLIFLIACFNVANVMLACALGRQREIAIRLSLGATRVRVLRQLLTESVFLACLAGSAGLLCAIWLSELLGLLKPPMPLPVQFDFSPDSRVLAFTVAVSVLAGIVFGLAPALRMINPRLSGTLRDRQTATSFSRGRTRLQQVLLVAQVGLSLFLLVSAGLCVRSLRNAEGIDLGFTPANLLTMHLNMTMAHYDEVQGRQFLKRLVDHVEALPGVRTATLTTTVPLGADTIETGVEIDGYQPRSDERPTVYMNAVGTRYFKTMAIPLVEGREFNDHDHADSPPVLVVNHAAARRYWPGESAVGRTMRIGGKQWQIVGVAADSRYVSLREAPEPLVYLPTGQQHFGWTFLIVKTAGDPNAIVSSVLRQLERIDPNIPASDIHTMEDRLGFVLLPSRLLGILIGGFGLLALVLSVTGVYGVVAHLVSQRAHEFAIRTALGAHRGTILWLVLRHGLLIGGAGLIVGLAGAAAFTRVLSGLLHDVNPTDPLIFVLVAGFMLLVVLLACFVPARRAIKVDPIVALRHE